MRLALAPVVLVAAATALVACNSILGISDHEEATQGGDGGTKVSDSGHEGGRKGRDSEPDDGSSGSPDGSTPGDDSGEDSGDAEPAGNEGGAVTLCASGADACVFGGIFSVGRVPNEAGIGALPDGAPVTLTDDGFEFGGTTCDDAGVTCVTGALSP
jgi:hypothetical protein